MTDKFRNRNILDIFGKLSPPSLLIELENIQRHFKKAIDESNVLFINATKILYDTADFEPLVWTWTIGHVFGILLNATINVFAIGKMRTLTDR